jgi:hypothetical protein
LPCLCRGLSMSVLFLNLHLFCFTLNVFFFHVLRLTCLLGSWNDIKKWMLITFWILGGYWEDL